LGKDGGLRSEAFTAAPATLKSQFRVHLPASRGPAMRNFAPGRANLHTYVFVPPQFRLLTGEDLYPNKNKYLR
jgi:hypothetical protein